MTTPEVLVALYQDALATAYPQAAPFHPPEIYPEYPFRSRATDASNRVYPAVREVLRYLELDTGHYGTAAWNPLGQIVRPGSRVLIKPNLVFHTHERLGLDGIDAVVTHAAILRAIIDYVIIALGQGGAITIADTPLVSAEFDSLLKITQIPAVCDFYHLQGREVQVLDLRPEAILKEVGGPIGRRVKLAGDPLGYAEVRLDRDSAFDDLERFDNLRIDSFDKGEIMRHHQRGSHQYAIARSVLSCDTFINVPKLKTHCKAGVSLSLKNLIGINGYKQWLPHFAAGSPDESGDEYPVTSAAKRLEGEMRQRLMVLSPMAWRAARWAGKRLLAIGYMAQQIGGRRPVAKEFYDTKGGAWYGNDTLWRTILDLNRILFYADKDGCMQTTRQRNYLTLIDGIIGGAGEGPLQPDLVSAGIVVGSLNPVAADIITARAMGFDAQRIESIRQAQPTAVKYPLWDCLPSEIRCASNDAQWTALPDASQASLGFKPPVRWRGHIER